MSRRKTGSTSKTPNEGSTTPPKSPSPLKKPSARSGSATFEVEILPTALKGLEALPSKLADQVIARIRALANDPRPPGAKRLKGKEWQGHLRIRSGDYRIIYRIVDDRLLVVVVKIGNRKDIYD
ncbi:MAG: type II toxin-antitoxin system RelE/ParE family toxin [Isosphaeraceae bacterium]